MSIGRTRGKGSKLVGFAIWKKNLQRGTGVEYYFSGGLSLKVAIEPAPKNIFYLFIHHEARGREGLGQADRKSRFGEVD